YLYIQTEELTYHIHDDEEIPIWAWGIVPITYYGQKQDHSEYIQCENCTGQCSQGGVEIISTIPIDAMEACSAPYCIYRENPHNNETLIFPREIMIKPYTVTIKLWKSGLVSKRLKLECPPKPFCELIHCYFCLTFIENPHCAPKGALILLGFIIYLSLSIIYLLFAILRVIIACSFTCSRLIILCCLKGVQYIIRRIINLRSSSPPERKNRYFRSALRKTGALIVIAIPLSHACSISTLLQASQSSCLQYENGSFECILTTSARLMVAPQGQQSCLLLKDMNSRPLGTLTIQLKKIALRCKKKSLYFTRSFQMAVASSKRCSAAGSCSGNKCTNITIDTKLPEFEKHVNDAPGFTYCMESSGCAACGCFLCDPACLFYRTYARPTS
ncbi:Envelope glycoprotein, partial [Toxocara canis]